MNLKNIIENANLGIREQDIFYNESMAKHTTFKVGGPAECMIKIKSIKDMKNIIKFASKNDIDITIIGNGSNILVLDKGIKGIVLLNRLENIQIVELDDGKIEFKAGAGTKISAIASKCLKEEITGFEELSGIPGTIGGAVVMNAGAHGKEIKDILYSIKCLDYNGNEYEFLNKDLDFGYRNSKLKNKKYIVTEVKLILQKGNKEQIQDKMEQYKKYRKEKQPIEYPSAGSTFKRGIDYITAKLIDDAGLKGYKIGGAQISTKHSGFVINTGNATAKDILELVQYIKEQIKLKFDKDIELEIQILGEE